MTTAEQISQLITDLKAQGKPLSEIAWTAAKACLGWAYVFGARDDAIVELAEILAE